MAYIYSAGSVVGYVVALGSVIALTLIGKINFKLFEAIFC